jgi:hypothetical protein
LEELSNGKGRLAETSEEGQGPHRSVETMMMMMRRLHSAIIQKTTIQVFTTMKSELSY